MPTFRLQGKSFFLTYPQVSFAKTALYEFLQTKGNVTYACIAQEAHEDGNPHMHIIVKYAQRRDFRNAQCFDYLEHHPNVQKPRNYAASVTYVKKDGEWEEFGEPKVSLLDQAKNMTWTDWLEYCCQKRIPFGYCQAIWKAVTTVSKTLEVDYVIQGVMDESMWQILPLFLGARKSIWIKGPSGIGKTTAAAIYAPKPCLLVTHMDDLKDLSARHQSIVFDDMSFVHMPRETQIQLVDREYTRSIHCRHRTATIPAGIVKIFTSNVDIFIDDEAINRRIDKLEIN